MIVLDLSILNQKGTPMFYSDIFANRPAAGVVGRMFISTDTFAFYRDTGSGWDLIGGPGVGTITGNGTAGKYALFAGAQVIGDGSLSETMTKVSTNKDFEAAKLITTGGLSSQFVKGDGSLDATAYQPLLTNPITGTGTATQVAFFNGATDLASDSNLFWNNTSKYLGIGTSTPSVQLDISGAGVLSQFNGTGTNDAFLQFQNAGVNKWRIGNAYVGSSNYFQLFDNTASVERIKWETSGDARFYGKFLFYNSLTNDVAKFSAAEPNVIIEAAGVSNTASLSFNPSANFASIIQAVNTGGYLQFNTGGNARMVVRNDGNILIGTTSNYQNRLQVDGVSNAGTGGIRIIASNSVGGLTIANFSAANKEWDFSPQGNDLLLNESGVGPVVYFKAGGTIRFYNYTTDGFLKTSSSDGTITVDTTSYVPTTRNLTINGVTQNLSADRTWTISTNNIYNSDGTLTGNRTITSGGYLLKLIGTNTASAGLAQGLYLNQTLKATANNDTLVALDITASFDADIYTGIKYYGVKANGQLKLTSYTSTAAFTGSVTGYLAFDNQGNILSVAAPTSTNIYNSDGTLTGDRILTSNGNSLTILGGKEVVAQQQIGLIIQSSTNTKDNLGFTINNTITGSANYTFWVYKNGNFYIRNNTDGKNSFLIQKDGNVQIGSVNINSTINNNSSLNVSGGISAGNGLKVFGNISPATGNGLELYFASNLGYVMAFDRDTSTWRGLELQAAETKFRNGGTYSGQIFSATGNWLIQTGGTFTDAGYKFDINGTCRVQNDFTIADNKNIILNTTNGTKIGTATNQKLAFYNSTPIIQPANTVAINDVLVNLGLRASGGVSNFTTNIDISTKDIVTDTVTGTKLGTGNTQKLGFWNTAPIAQPTTAVGSATIASPGAGNVIKDDDTFDGYTLAQVVKALRNIGLLQ